MNKAEYEIWISNLEAQVKSQDEKIRTAKPRSLSDVMILGALMRQGYELRERLAEARQQYAALFQNVDSQSV